MKRAVFFITPHMDDPNIDTLIQPLIQRAVQNHIRVFVWFTDADLYAATTSAAAFNTLALQTGGAYFSATGAQPYPNPNSYFAPLRRLYSLQYISRVAAGGSHSYIVDVKSKAGDIKSAEQPFTVDIQAPNPMFVSPPLQIVRRPPDNDPYNDKVLLPESQKLDIIVEFPDGHNRSLVRTTLSVDGQVVAENKAPPFDSFTWDLSGYTESGEHKIVVEAVDDLNLSKTSMEIPVSITVIQPPHGLAAMFGRYRDNITLAAVALAGLVLLMILFLGRFRMAYVRAQSSRQAQADPLTQEVMPAVEEPITGKENKRPRGAGPPQLPTRKPNAWKRAPLFTASSRILWQLPARRLNRLQFRRSCSQKKRSPLVPTRCNLPMSLMTLSGAAARPHNADGRWKFYGCRCRLDCRNLGQF